MIPRLNISFSIKRQLQYWFGHTYMPIEGEFLLNHARSGLYLALKTALPEGGKVGVMAYNCDTVMNPVLQAGCEVIFLDVNEDLTLSLYRDTVPICKFEELDAIVVSNLFGIKNNIATIREAYPNALIIEDNAHGYGLEEAGDVILYSIDQGKYPALGPGGILKVKNEYLKNKIETEYNTLPKVGIMGQVKTFISMLIKAIMYHPWVYRWLTKPIKDGMATKSGLPESIHITRMCPGVSRMYNSWVKEHAGQSVAKPFMDIIRTNNPEQVISEYSILGIEVDTHFKHWPEWAKHYGYVAGTCPMAEQLINELVMVPNYFKK